MIAPDSATTPVRRRRWLLIVLAVGVVAVVAVVATVAILVTTWHGAAPFVGRPNWTPPAQTLLSSSMVKQPVPGWTVNLDGLGLPADSKIATSDDAYWSQPLVGTLDERAYFLANGPGSSVKRWWLVGVDTRSGQKLFAPTELTVGADVPTCMTNGPATVLCLLDDVQNAVVVGSTAWVIDARTGAVTYTGPARVHVTGDRSVHPVGIYAVATTTGEGVYGVGPAAEPTWFVPGDGRLPGSPTVDLATAPPTQTTQGTGDPVSNRKVVFSVVDGSVITPDLSPQRSPRSAIIYPGGFAVHVEPAESTPTPSDGVEFFDDRGKQLGSADIEGSFAPFPTGLPIVTSGSDATVFSPRGDELAKVSGYSDTSTFLVGPTLFVEDSSRYESAWRRVDLNTGTTKDGDCRTSMVGFLASDGTVGVFERGNPNVGTVTTAVDLSTCEVRWTITSALGSFRDVWRADTTLVQLSDNGTELSSMVSP